LEFARHLQIKLTDQKNVKPLQERTESKLRFAAVHLEELQKLGHAGGSDFDRAHEESFLYHLLGAKDAFLQELNVYYGCNLETTRVTSRALAEVLERRKLNSRELDELAKLERPGDGNWLYSAKNMRDHATHVAGNPRAFHMGGSNHGKVFLRDSRNKLKDSGQHFVDEFATWLSRMLETLARLRQSALEANKLLR
jgi:hypothetical protein